MLGLGTYPAPNIPQGYRGDELPKVLAQGEVRPLLREILRPKASSPLPLTMGCIPCLGQLTLHDLTKRAILVTDLTLP